MRTKEGPRMRMWRYRTFNYMIAMHVYFCYTGYNTTEQFTSCSLTCVPGYEKLTDVCCKTGVDIVCSNLPWNQLLPHVANCSVHLQSDLRGKTPKAQVIEKQRFLTSRMYHSIMAPISRTILSLIFKLNFVLTKT